RLGRGGALMATRVALRDCEAVLFDLDGVLTPTATAHERAWARTFDQVFAELGVTPPLTDDDFYQHLDGKPRYAAVAALMTARGVRLDWGDPGDPPEAMTVCGIGNRKNAAFAAVLAEEGVRAYPGS